MKPNIFYFSTLFILHLFSCKKKIDLELPYRAYDVDREDVYGQVPEWSKGADLRSAVQRTRGFEPHLGHGHEQPVARAPSGGDVKCSYSIVVSTTVLWAVNPSSSLGRSTRRFSSMEEQSAYCWKDVGSTPTTSAVGWDGAHNVFPEKSVAYSNSNNSFELPKGCD